MNRSFQEFGRQKNRSKKVDVGWDLDQWSPSTDRVWPDVRDPPPTKSHQDSQSHQDEGLSIPLASWCTWSKIFWSQLASRTIACLMQWSRLCTLSCSSLDEIVAVLSCLLAMSRLWEFIVEQHLTQFLQHTQPNKPGWWGKWPGKDKAWTREVTLLCYNYDVGNRVQCN